MAGLRFVFLGLYFLSLIGLLAVEMYVFTRPENSDEFSAYSIADACDHGRMPLWRTQSEAFEFLYGCAGKRIEFRSFVALPETRSPSCRKLYQGVAFELWFRFLSQSS